MTADAGGSPEASLTAEEQDWIQRVCSAGSLSELSEIVGIESEHEAYFEAKEQWRQLLGKQQDGIAGQFPGESIHIDGRKFVVHGITHADTDEEREFLHDHVSSFLDDGATVYCEQGIRRMYFEEFPAVYAIDDYSWAMYHCREEGINSHVDDPPEPEFERVTDNLTSLVSQFRTATFSLIKSGSDVYGDRFAKVLGDVASDFLLNHEHVATAEDFHSFRKSQQASRNPALLGDLQRYYRRAFLPQPLEREWLRRHDRELELFTHARNERIADYAVYHSDSGPVHIIVGAAHQPGVVYYLEQHRDGKRDVSEFEPVG